MRQTRILTITTILWAGLLVCWGGCRSAVGPHSAVATRTQGEATFAAIDSKRVLEAALHYPKEAAVQEIPMSLTGSDGTGLKLVSLEAKAVVQGPLAFTELHLTFHNPEDRVREGRFTIALPTGAAISRFAMKIGQGWQEAEVVERQAARQIYEDFLHRRQDPALLEKKAGNEFRARIFPIPARADKEIIVSYSQNLPSKDTPYRIHLKGLPKIHKLAITAMVGEQVEGKAASSLGGVTVTHKVIKVNKTDFAPDQDFEVQPHSSIQGLRHGNLAVMRVSPNLPADRASMDSLLLLVDTSASRAPGFLGQVKRLGALLDQLKQTYGPDTALHLACFDQVVSSVYQGPLGEFGEQDLNLILARRPLGASDLHGALSWVQKTRGYRRVLLVTDGIATAGETDPGALRRAAKQLGSSVQRLDVLLVGGIQDEQGMRQLVSGTAEEDGVVLDGALPVKQLAERLGRKTVSGIRVAVPRARWVWPSQLDSMQPGDQALVFADLPEGALPEGKPMTVTLSGPVSERLTGKLAQVKRPLLERAWIEARIANMERQSASGDLDPDMRGAIVKKIIELSTAHRVLCDHTALLVLETENDYARYNIKRNALADILVVGQSGLEVLQRNQVLVPEDRPRPPPPPRRPMVRADEGRAEEAPQPQATPGPAAETRREAREAPAIPAPAKASAPRPQAAPRPKLKLARSMSRRHSSGREVPSAPAPEPSMAADEERPRQQERAVEKKPEGPPALSGKLAELAGLIKEEKVEQALVDALRWRAEQPGDVMALLALGMALEAHGNTVLAARVYGSIIDLFPSRADMRRFASERLEALGKAGQKLAADSYKQAVSQRPDHALGHRLLGFALVRLGKLDEALAALEAGVKQQYRIERPGVRRILLEDLGLAAAALVARHPGRKNEVASRIEKLGARIADKPSLRFVLNWETDANDVDFHIRDNQDGHAYYSSRQLPSGGVLYDDVTNGYGPECFTINGEPTAFPYRLQIHYYSRGPMGYGMGKLQIVQHDGKGGLRFEDRPFVVMNDRAFVDLGQVKGPL
jgi:tetratricopeptide (TPR) repeat protein